MAADWNFNQSLAEKLLKIRGHTAKIGFRSELPSAVIDVVKSTGMMVFGSHYLNLGEQAWLRSRDISLASRPVQLFSLLTSLPFPNFQYLR